MISQDQKQVEFSYYLDNAPIGVFVANSKGEYTKVNKEASNVTGFSKKKLLSMSVADLITKDHLEMGLNAFKELQTKGEIKIELKFQKKDGSMGWWILDAIKLSEDQLIAYTTDITNQKNAEEKLKKKMAELENLNEIMVGREIKMTELKQAVKRLQGKSVTKIER